MERAAVDRPLENQHGCAFWILGIFLDDNCGPSPHEDLVNCEPIVSQRVVPVLGYSHIT